ncbi:MAG: SocA family protein [Dysgonamonadaceae bacterium]|jgi:uncharacterized phage-associated protein|nr:SocA family protein [Dysgonamonadaceae bacterium]
MFHEKKALNSALYIANRLNRKDFHKIFKILYFSDREHLCGYGRAITGDTYIAMPDGPVPSNIYDIFKSVRGDGFYKDNGKFSEHFSVADWDLIRPKHDADLDELSVSDVECIDHSIKLYGSLSWDEIREKSHDYAWRATTLGRPVTYDNILREQGATDEFIDYVKEDMLLQDCFAQ